MHADSTSKSVTVHQSRCLTIRVSWQHDNLPTWPPLVSFFFSCFFFVLVILTSFFHMSDVIFSFLHHPHKKTTRRTSPLRVSNNSRSRCRKSLGSRRAPNPNGSEIGSVESAPRTTTNCRTRRLRISTTINPLAPHLSPPLSSTPPASPSLRWSTTTSHPRRHRHCPPTRRRRPTTTCSPTIGPRQGRRGRSPDGGIPSDPGSAPHSQLFGSRALPHPLGLDWSRRTRSTPHPDTIGRLLLPNGRSSHVPCPPPPTASRTGTDGFLDLLLRKALRNILVVIEGLPVM